MSLDDWYNNVWLGQEESYTPGQEESYTPGMNRDAWYNKVWLGQESYTPGMTYEMTQPVRGYHYQATAGTLPSYRRERMGRKSSPKRRASPTRAHLGSSSAGRYPPQEGPFCGSAGGAAADTFPVKDFEHIRNALSRARFAPDPKGVRTCACARAQALGLKGHFPSCPQKD